MPHGHLLALSYLEICLKHVGVCGACADHYMEDARLNRETHLSVVKAEERRRELERDAARFSRLQRDALEAFQLHHGARYGRGHVAYVKLYCFVARATACVYDFNARGQFTARQNALCAQLQIGETKLCVT